MIAPKHDPNSERMCWDQVAAELKRRGILDDPRTFLFTDSWERAAGLALAVRGKADVACYDLEPRSYSFWSRPKDYVGRDGIFVQTVKIPGVVAHYNPFFTHYEPIGALRIVRRGVFVREVYLYRGTHQIGPFPFDGRFRDQIERRKARNGSTAGLVDTSIARRPDKRRGSPSGASEDRRIK